MFALKQNENRNTTKKKTNARKYASNAEREKFHFKNNPALKFEYDIFRDIEW